MGKKAKIGKSRRDKAYWSAKEIGYRSRASFKLIQLNRKFEFLQKSRVCIDLCAAPGSWMQVAKEHMPASSLIVGVDLVPIKPVPGCINLIGDVTADKCRSDLKRQLQTWKADLVLNDGAPNVGKSWVHDAYNQSLLTLSAFKLASDFLVRGGAFVTKIFRSKDYQSLIWVFNQFFKRVHATKPAASRHESAEIFVVCLGYKAPDKIDPKFLDAKYVFSDVDESQKASDEASNRELVNPEKRKKKTAAEGYADGATLLFGRTNASDFVMGDKPIHLLNNSHEIVLDEARIRKHEATTQEVVECCKDVKVLGMKELRLLKKWREILRTDFRRRQEEEEVEEEESNPTKESEDDDDDDADAKMLEDQIDKLKEEERRAARRQKKKKLKAKQKLTQKINLKMILPGDQGPVRQEDGLFFLSEALGNVESVVNQEPDAVADDSDDDEDRKMKYEKYNRDDAKRLDKSGLYYKDESSDDDDDKSDDSDREDLGLEGDPDDDDDDDDQDEAEIDRMNEPSRNPLLVELESGDGKSRKERKADVWFDKDVFKGIDEDDDLEEADVEAAMRAVKMKGGKMLNGPSLSPSKCRKDSVVQEVVVVVDDAAAAAAAAAVSSSSDSDESDYEENEFYPYRNRKSVEETTATTTKDGFEIVPKAKKRPILTPEELALGQELISSKKRRRDLTDAAWNRYTFDDDDKDLPDWFVKEEEHHMRRMPDVDPRTVQYYRDGQNDVGVKTIKKVVEAKARKKRKLVKRMDKAKKRAANVLENEDLGSREKAKEIQRLYRRAASAGKKKEMAYVVAKKATAAKRAKRPANIKGPYKQVDPRMKKDNLLKRAKSTSKRVQKRRLKGRKTKPQQQQQQRRQQTKS